MFNGKQENRTSSGNSEDVFAIIALTNLSPQTGWWILLEGSHNRVSKTALDPTWRRVEQQLAPGDAIVMLAHIACLPSLGQDGIFETLVYKK
jgi:hypothetical protein